MSVRGGERASLGKPGLVILKLCQDDMIITIESKCDTPELAWLLPSVTSASEEAGYPLATRKRPSA